MAGPVQVTMIKVVNRLKEKLGFSVRDEREGEIDPASVERADKLIEKLCEHCQETIEAHLIVLAEHWEKMRDMPESDERKEHAEQIFTLAHEIKDIASLCGYSIAAYFAESLRDYIALTELSLEAQRVIIQAHVDALTVVTKQGMKDDGGPAAEELKKMVKIAIEKYS